MRSRYLVTAAAVAAASFVPVQAAPGCDLVLRDPLQHVGTTGNDIGKVGYGNGPTVLP